MTTCICKHPSIFNSPIEKQVNIVIWILKQASILFSNDFINLNCVFSKQVRVITVQILNHCRQEVIREICDIAKQSRAAPLHCPIIWQVSFDWFIVLRNFWWHIWQHSQQQISFVLLLWFSCVVFHLFYALVNYCILFNNHLTYDIFSNMTPHTNCVWS